MPEQAKIIVNGREYAMPDSFTLGELADIEQITGQGYDLAKPGVRGMVALAYIAIHRTDPRVTVDDIRALTPEAITAVGGDDADPLPPTTSSAGSDNEPSSAAGSSNGSEPSPAETPAVTGSPV